MACPCGTVVCVPVCVCVCVRACVVCVFLCVCRRQPGTNGCRARCWGPRRPRRTCGARLGPARCRRCTPWAVGLEAGEPWTRLTRCSRTRPPAAPHPRVAQARSPTAPVRRPSPEAAARRCTHSPGAGHAGHRSVCFRPARLMVIAGTILSCKYHHNSPWRYCWDWPRAHRSWPHGW